MQYDSFKAQLNSVFGEFGYSRKFFYFVLENLLLRSWHLKQEIRKWRDKHKNKVAYVLDAGCGFGQHCYFINKMAPQWALLGVDIHKEFVAKNNMFFRQEKMNNVHFQTTDVCTLPYEESFDLILSVDVLTYLENDVEVMGKFHKALKTGGSLIICTPSQNLKGGGSLVWGKEENSIGCRKRDGYDKQLLRQKLNEAGFSEIYMRYIYGWPGRISRFLSINIPLNMLNKSEWLLPFLFVYYPLVYPVCMVLNYLDIKRRHRSGMGIMVNAVKTD